MTSRWAKRRVLIVGGAGFIGSHVTERLLDRGARVRVVTRSGRQDRLGALSQEIEWMQGDIREQRFCAEALREQEEVLHLASFRHNVQYHRTHHKEVFTENVRLSLAMIAAVAKHPLPVAFCSTANIPEHADRATLAASSHPDGYVLGKLACEEAWTTAARRYGFPLLIVRPVNVYGPRDTFSADGNVIPALLWKAEQSSDYLEIWGSGEQKRAFLYVEDLAEAFLRLLEAHAEGVQYVAPPEQQTIRELATLIRDLIRPALPLHFDVTSSEGHHAMALPSLHPSLESLRWTPLPEGLRRTVDWWKRNR